MTNSIIDLNDEILLKVEKPARYIGGEVNMCKKDPQDAQIRFAICFPDVYEVGMSNLGMQILYFLLNRKQGVYCERVFSPWVDMAQQMHDNDIPLFSLETRTPITQFDFLGITLQYEMSYTNVLNILSMARIPILAKDRKAGDPIVVAGGPCAYNPEPLAEFIDFFYIGDGEAKLYEVMDIYYETKDRDAFLEKILTIEGIYVPKFYDVTYNEKGQITAFEPNHPQAPSVIQKAIVKDLNEMFVPTEQIVPFIEVVHDRVALELFRGCIRGCRFCQAGFIYRPVREKSVETLREQSKKLLNETGHEEISLLSLSTSDYTELPLLINCLADDTNGENISFSLPSLRVDNVNLSIMEKLQGPRKSSLTFAPEAGTQRLRDVINKGISETEILDGCYMAFSSGWDKVKLYFMVGLPTESTEDLEGIALLSEKIVEKFYELPKDKRSRPVAVSVSASAYVPKPFTPFQWEEQNTMEEFHQKQQIIKKKMTKRQVKFHYHDAKTSIIEGILSRGDRRLSKVLIQVMQEGACFEGWSEFFDYAKWENAFQKTGLTMQMYTRKRELDEILPWGHINIGVSTAFFVNEREKAYNGETTPNCNVQCVHCGAAKFQTGICQKEGDSK